MEAQASHIASTYQMLASGEGYSLALSGRRSRAPTWLSLYHLWGCRGLVQSLEGGSLGPPLIFEAWVGWGHSVPVVSGWGGADII